MSEKARDFARRIIDSGQTTETLIQDLLAYSKVSLEDFEPKMVGLDSVMTTVMEQIDGDIRQSGARVDVQRPMPEVTGDHTILVQVVINLISNSIKFVGEGVAPEITVRTEDRDEIVRLWVEDNGVGIAENQREKIFRTFERTAASQHLPGTGIGLAIVRRGMERIGGGAGVDSTVGEGSHFWIDLPRLQAESFWPWSGRRSR